MERTIGATELRQKLTDVLQDVREQGRTYVIQTFGRPQAAIVNMEEFRLFQRFAEERREYFDWLRQNKAAPALAEVMARIASPRIPTVIRLSKASPSFSVVVTLLPIPRRWIIAYPEDY